MVRQHSYPEREGLALGEGEGLGEELLGGECVGCAPRLVQEAVTHHREALGAEAGVDHEHHVCVGQLTPACL